MNKLINKLKISNLFTIIMACIISGSMTLAFLIISMLMSFHINPFPGILTSSAFIVVLSVGVGMVISTFVSKKILSPILEIENAAKKVSAGDYSVRLEEKSMAKEIREIARDFNIMVKESSNTETLRNDFVSNVSHEFKTPLAAIDGYTVMLQDDTLAREDQKKYLDYILDNTGRLSGLVKNILSLSRLENQEIVLEKEYFSLDEQIRRVLLGYEKRWEEKDLSICLNLENVMFYGNPTLLAQVWSNLIDNAIKFSKKNGIFSIDCVSIGNRITVVVKDTGLGMDEEEKKHAFDKFYQADCSHHVKGNGLGLALVKRIVTLCEGTVNIDSKKGEGTSVLVIFE